MSTDHDGGIAVLQYIDALKAHDWDFDFSDDHRVWQRGARARDALRDTQRAIDPHFEIWNQYAPEAHRRQA